MKKIFILLIIGVIVLLFLMYPKTSGSDEDITTDYESKYGFYKPENKERYLIYQNKNKNLDFEDVIVRVNLNLDREFYTNIKLASNLNTNYVLVNKYNYLDKDYIPNNLVKMEKYTNKEKFLVKEALDNFIKMGDDMNNLGMRIRAISGYRSYSYQENLYNNYVEKDGVNLADTYSARPGFSEHQTGLVVDIDNGSVNYEEFENTKEFIWLKDNSYKYGFILRYPQKKESITGYSYESWHYRYVGFDIAKIIYETDITFDEYYAKYIDN